MKSTLLQSLIILTSMIMGVCFAQDFSIWIDIILIISGGLFIGTLFYFLKRIWRAEK